MSKIRPFQCVRPEASKADKIAALPYDVYSSGEAREVVEKNRLSFLAIDRAETAFPPAQDMYAPKVYEKARELFEARIADGSFIEDEDLAYYLYELTMDSRTQTGLVACSSIADYENGVIKKHENTRADKELDRIRHVDTVSAQTGPIFLAYRANDVVKDVTKRVKEDAPLYDFVSDDGIRHRVFKVASPKDIETLTDAFEKIGDVYIADGHHRAASAVKVGQMRREKNPAHTGDEEYNFFLSVLFPDEELYIMDYNRLLKSLGDYDAETYLEAVKKIFDVEEIGNPQSEDEKKPHRKGEMTLYLNKKWYLMKVREEDIPPDVVGRLDVSLLQNLLLTPLLHITDPKTDRRIDFVGGIRGMKELERRCEKDAVCAIAMYPTSITELMEVADAGLLMPPKSTWFEPKLRSGLFIHKI